MASTTPIKSQPSKPSDPIKSEPSKASSPISVEIETPEKPSQPRSRRLATLAAEIGQSDEDLTLVEVPMPSWAQTPIRLPEKHEILAEFFNSMESSIRLIRMKGSSPTFPNICASIQNLTDRRFTYEHLAQLKYVFPEAIVVKKVLLHDDITCCMKPELHVSLEVDAIGSDEKREEESGYLDLRRVFRERLVNFSKEHPEEDIPADQLPLSLNQAKPSFLLDGDYVPSNVQPSSDTSPVDLFSAASHMPRAFQRRFSQKQLIPSLQKSALACYDKALLEDDLLDSVASSLVECIVRPPVGSKSSSISCPLRTHEEEAKKSTKSNDMYEKNSQAFHGTPAKPVSTPVRLMTATPEIQTPKRCRSTMEFDSPSFVDFKSPLPKKPTKRSTRTKLFMTPTKIAIKEDDSSDDVIGFLPESLLQSVREKESKVLEEKDAVTVEEKRRQRLLVGLPNIYDAILLMTQAFKRSVMTKQELIFKIIANNTKIVDRGEVEEQLKLLRELVPEWISEKVALSGDVLCCVNKVSNPEEIRQRLAEAE